MFIEEGLKQKTRQTVVVLDWGSRSNATLGNFGVKVYEVCSVKNDKASVAQMRDTREKIR